MRLPPVGPYMQHEVSNGLTVGNFMLHKNYVHEMQHEVTNGRDLICSMRLPKAASYM